MPRWLDWAAGAVVLGLVIWAFLARLDALTSSPYPLGVDGYFYPVQLRSLLETGELYYPSAPLAIWLMAPFAAATDPVTGAKIGAALLTSLCAVPVFFLGRRIGGDAVMGLLAAVLIVTSAESFYLSSEFVKSGVGLTVAAVYMVLLLRALDQPGGWRVIAAVAGLAATALTHKQATGLALVVTVPAIAARAWSRGWRPAASDRATRIALALLALGAGVLVVLGVGFPDRFLGARDVALVTDLFTSSADPSVPVLAPTRGEPLRFGHEALIAGIAGLVALALPLLSRALPRERAPAREHAPAPAPARALALALAAVAVLTAVPWIDVSDPEGLGFRLRLIAFLPLAVVVPFVAASLLGNLTALTRTAIIAGFVVGWVASRPPTTMEGTVVVEGHMQAAIRAADGVVPEDDVIICPQRSLVFMITWYTGNRARLRPEEIPPERRWRLIPSALIHPELMAAIDRLRLEGDLPIIGLHPRHRNGVVLMPERSWQWLLEQLPDDLATAYRQWKTI